jgi:predicted NUDIX family NTP pyrophosphohydrolase
LVCRWVGCPGYGVSREECLSLFSAWHVDRDQHRAVDSLLSVFTHEAVVLPHHRTQGETRVAKRSAGLLLFRRRGETIEVFLVHPGGPLWAKKDLGAWSIPKGQYADGEEPLAAARREFTEETGFAAPTDATGLGEVKQASGKSVMVWAAEGACDPEKLVSNQCEIEWPPRSGRKMEIPEVDRGAWFAMDEARERILQSQQPFLDRLRSKLES